MNKCNNKKNNLPAPWRVARSRMKGRERRTRDPIQLSITLPDYAIHNLTDTAMYRVHAYRASPGFFAIRTAVVISVHDLFVYAGVTYKVARCETVSEGCVEVRGLVFGRLQG